MARTVLPIAGAVVGFYFGGAAGAQWGYALGSVAASAIPAKSQGPRIGETAAQTSQEGAFRAIVHGTAMVTGNVIASGTLIKRDVEENQGGKGGTDVSSEHCYRTYAIRVCEGPIGGYLRIWEDDKLVYDIRPGSTTVADSLQWVDGVTFYLGGEDQLPSPVLEAKATGTNTPAYRGSAYIVFDERDLTDRRGSIPQYRFEVSSGGEVTELDVVPTSLADGTVGGGEFSSGFSASVYLDAAAMGPGEVWLASMTFEPYGFADPTTVRCFVNVGGAEVWGAGLDLVHSFASRKVQINHVRDHTQLQYGFTGAYNGDFKVQVARLSPSDVYTAYADGSAPPVAYADDHEFFGVIVDEDGDLHSADEVFADDRILSWGPTSINVIGNGASAVLADIVADTHTRCGIDSSKYDVSELPDIVRGVVFASDYAGADAIDALRKLYLFDKSDYDKVLHYPKRGKPVVATLTIDDLVEEPDTSTREQAIEFPRKLHLIYQNPEGGYATAKATSARSTPDARVVGESTVEVPVSLNADQAAQASAKLHKISYAEAEGETKLAVPLSFIKYVPGDCFGIALRGTVVRRRMEEMEYSEGVISYTMRGDRQSAYTSDVTGIPIPTPTPPPSSIVGATVLAFLDIASRIDSEDDLNYYVAGTGGLPGWYGYVLQRSLDGGASYADVQGFDRAAVMGVILDDVPAASEHYTDSTNTVRVQLYRDTQVIDSITEMQFLSEGGAFALEKADGSYEILQYLDADEEGGGIFVLSTLHRGLLNSGASAHLAGALFVMLSRAEHIPAQSAWIGQALTHRAPSFGQSPEGAIARTDTYVGRSQIEWSVEYLDLAREGSDIVSGTWVPRHRFGSDVAPVESINFRGFRVTLDDGVATPVTFDTTAPSFVYDASSLGSPLTVSVSSINRITGAGPATSGAV